GLLVEVACLVYSFAVLEILDAVVMVHLLLIELIQLRYLEICQKRSIAVVRLSEFYGGLLLVVQNVVVETALQHP
ncbi:MAG: hypothetical protein V2I33_19200, partial [Kangiellaceae bacterium]|nr:hypothetical protein [Kangiellaceae bacterium]